VVVLLLMMRNRKEKKKGKENKESKEVDISNSPVARITDIVRRPF